MIFGNEVSYREFFYDRLLPAVAGETWKGMPRLLSAPELCASWNANLRLLHKTLLEASEKGELSASKLQQTLEREVVQAKKRLSSLGNKENTDGA